ncbi:MAG: aldehyde dehydrogenase family protein [Candidatus Diapherotrites archaeon]|nr:aldehyde dehydrogenase family protein [Candidatus Diapherotrites archaeon]
MASTHGHYINGKWVQASTRKTFPSINPATEKAIGRFALGNENDVEKAVRAAENAFHAWSHTPAPKRAEVLYAAARIMEEKKEWLARRMTEEMGKVLREARGDVQEAIDITYYMAGEGRRMFSYTAPSELKNKTGYAMRRPIGIVGIITPWNFPLAIPAWKIMPALVGGNTIVFKPSSDTPRCAGDLVNVLSEAGLPSGVLNLVTGPANTAGQRIVQHPRIRALSFTGSKETGEWITRNAGVKRVGLELGGKNGILVMDDADLELAVEGILWGAFGTTGQRCTAASRVLVHEGIEKELTEMLIKKVEKLKLGNGLKEETDVGPLINKRALEKVHEYAEIGKKEGKLLCGGNKVEGKGSFFEPTVFTRVKPHARIAQEEIFGPVLCILHVKDLGQGIQVMNGIDYGLSSSIYTSNLYNAMKAIEEIEAGITYVNSSTIGAEIHYPFGGIKGTGNGTREAGWTGIEEFTEIKTVYIDYSGKLQKAQGIK